MAEERARISIVDVPSRSRGGEKAPGERTVTIGLTLGALILTLALGAGIRLWNIASVPPELHPDEYAGWLGITSMLAGKVQPSVFLSYGVVYLPLYGIFEVLSSLLFGVTATAFRLPAALLGTVTVLATGLVGYQFVPRRLVLLAAALTMAILPWDISVSRIGWEPAAMLPFLLFGLYFLRRGLYASSSRDIILAFALLAIGAYSYRAESFYAATLTIALLAIEFERTRKVAQDLWIGLAVALAILGPIALSVIAQPHMLTSGPAQGTFDPGVNAGSLAEFLNLYTRHFALSALFVTGDGNLQHGPPVGVLYPWMAPFILIGLLAPPGIFPLRARLFAVIWLLLYPFGGALTDENGGQHFIRTLAGAPLFCILGAIGLETTRGWIATLAARYRWPATLANAWQPVLVAAVCVQFAQFCSAYFVRYPVQAAHIFHYGDRDVFAFVKAHDAGVERVCFTSLDAWNYSAQTGFYMPGSTPALFGWMDPACKKAHTLLSLQNRSEAPPGAQFLGTVQNYDGTSRAFFYQLP